jgi:hypothetical protein
MTDSPFFMVEYTFSDKDRLIALDEAYRRQSVNEHKKVGGRAGGPANGAKALGLHVLGAAAELAVADYLGMREHLFGDSEAVRGSCDIPGIDIKCRSNHDFDLLVWIDDNYVDKKYVLVTIQHKKTVIVGWIDGKDIPDNAEIKEFRKGSRVYAVPHRNLKHIDELKKIIHPGKG